MEPPGTAKHNPHLLAAVLSLVAFPVIPKGSQQFPRNGLLELPIGSIVAPFRGLYLGSYKVIPKRNDYGAER